MTDQEFTTLADAALSDLFRRLSAAAENHDFDADFNAGTLAVEFEDPPTKFVVSPNSPVKQIWVSAHLKSFKLDWDAARNAFVIGGQTLAEMMADAVSKQLGETITL